MEIIDSFCCIGVQPEDDRALDERTLLDQMQCAGVAEALCIHFAAVRYDTRLGNDELLATCASHSRLHPLAAINPTPYVGVADEIRRCAARGCRGVRFAPGRQGWSMGSAPFVHALEIAAESGLPVSVETGGSGEPTQLAALAQGLSVPVILAAVSYATLGEAIAAMQRNPNLLLEACRLATPDVVELLVAEVGAKRLLFASGAPGWEIAPTLEMIRQADVSAAEIQAILGGNARRVYHLAPTGGAA